MKQTKRWVEIKEKDTHKLIRIVYNPYNKPTKEVLTWFIPQENLSEVYGVKTRGGIMKKQNAMPYRRYAKHTPGPWIVEEEETGKGPISHYIKEGDASPSYIIAKIVYINESEANARLIAAAPELLAAAIEAAKQLRSRGDTAHAAVLQAAIDKTKGGGNSLASPSESEE